MVKLPENNRLVDDAGRPLGSLKAINRLPESAKIALYSRLLPARLCSLLSIDVESPHRSVQDGVLKIIAPPGLSLVRVEARTSSGEDAVFFLELSDTQFHQMELSFCMIRDPGAPRFDVDVDLQGRNNWFTSHGRNIPEEIRAMEAGLFPNQVRRGLRMFGEFLPLLERFTEALDIEMIVAEPLTYDNAIRYEKYGFDYLRGKRLMLEINHGFQHGGKYWSRLDDSTPFRQPGAERTVRGRSWAIHDGILDEPWDEVQIYKIIGVHAGLNTFPEREQEQQ